MVKAKKKYGQNFLRDINLLKKIVESAQIKDKNVLEIGPGLGALTQFLVTDAKKYLAYEIDRSLTNELKKYEKTNSVFIFSDFLTDDINQTLPRYFDGEDVHLVGNLPYYITTPIVFKFLEYPHLKSATIMVQKEVGERMISESNLKSYNAFSAILQYHAKVSRILNVNKKMFYPVPKVDSMVVRLEKIEPRLSKAYEIEYMRLVKIAFAHKRKTLLNNLSEGYDLPKDVILPVLIRIGFDDKTRAESLSIDDLVMLTKNWIQNRLEK